MTRKMSVGLGILLIAITAAAQQPRLTNGKIEMHPVSGTLQSTLLQLAGTGEAPVWIGYTVPTGGSKPRLICCFDGSDFKYAGCCAGCRLEGRNNGYFNSDGGTCVGAEPPTSVFVFLRYTGGKLTRVRSMTPDCGIDAGGLTIHWLTDVRPRDSVAMLAGLISLQESSSEVQEMALSSLALHDDPSAEAALEKFVAAGQPERIREKAAFWMASQGGKHSFEVLRKLAREDKDDRFRHHLAFALSISHEPEAQGELIRMAHEDPAGNFRGQALFWLAQKAGRKVEAEISAAIENDPETEVKKKAVFALSQMPDGEGVTKLIEVARKNRNREVRKAAIFWLGQSHDARALAFIEEVLSR
jgi:hypothetical protein